MTATPRRPATRPSRAMQAAFSVDAPEARAMPVAKATIAADPSRRDWRRVSKLMISKDYRLVAQRHKDRLRRGHGLTGGRPTRCNASLWQLGEPPEPEALVAPAAGAFAAPFVDQ